jgi:hypothetical protein
MKTLYEIFNEQRAQLRLSRGQPVDQSQRMKRRQQQQQQEEKEEDEEEEFTTPQQAEARDSYFRHCTSDFCKRAQQIITEWQEFTAKGTDNETLKSRYNNFFNPQLADLISDIEKAFDSGSMDQKDAVTLSHELDEFSETMSQYVINATKSEEVPHQNNTGGQSGGGPSLSGGGGGVKTSEKRGPDCMGKQKGTAKTLAFIPLSGIDCGYGFARNKDKQEVRRYFLDDEIEMQAQEASFVPPTLHTNRMKIGIDLVGAKEEQKVLNNDFFKPNIYSGLKAPFNAMLMYGVAGNGKSFLASAIPTLYSKKLEQLTGRFDQYKVRYYTTSAAMLKSRWQGQTESRIRLTYKYLEQVQKELAKQEPIDEPPLIFLFIDELDNLLAKRKDGGSADIVNTFLPILEPSAGEYKNIVTVGATNLPWNLDGAILSRFSKRLHVDLPMPEAIQSMLYNGIVKQFTDSGDESLEVFQYKEAYDNFMSNVNNAVAMMTFDSVGAKTKLQEESGIDAGEYLNNFVDITHGGNLTSINKLKMGTFGVSSRDVKNFVKALRNELAEVVIRNPLPDHDNCYLEVPNDCKENCETKEQKKIKDKEIEIDKQTKINDASNNSNPDGTKAQVDNKKNDDRKEDKEIKLTEQQIKEMVSDSCRVSCRSCTAKDVPVRSAIELSWKRLHGLFKMNKNVIADAFTSVISAFTSSVDEADYLKVVKYYEEQKKK